VTGVGMTFLRRYFLAYVGLNICDWSLPESISWFFVTSVQFLNDAAEALAGGAVFSKLNCRLYRAAEQGMTITAERRFPIQTQRGIDCATNGYIRQ